MDSSAQTRSSAPGAAARSTPEPPAAHPPAWGVFPTVRAVRPCLTCAVTPVTGRGGVRRGTWLQRSFRVTRRSWGLGGLAPHAVARPPGDLQGRRCQYLAASASASRSRDRGSANTVVSRPSGAYQRCHQRDRRLPSVTVGRQPSAAWMKVDPHRRSLTTSAVSFAWNAAARSSDSAAGNSRPVRDRLRTQPCPEAAASPAQHATAVLPPRARIRPGRDAALATRQTRKRPARPRTRASSSSANPPTM
jgi:hypothetical protein